MRTGDDSDHALRIIAAVFFSWTVFIVVVTAADAFLPTNLRLPAQPLDFGNTGTFGDSFGVISALMASVAGYFAYRTYRSSQAELDAARKRAGEPTFLNLLERRFTLIDQVSCGQAKGVDAIANICNGIESGVRNEQAPAKMFADYTSGEGVRGLRNLFRYTYHIIRFAEDLFGFDPAAQGADKRKNGSYPYVRLLRAQLSDEDLLLIALNALHDPDGEAFKALLDRYGLLDNMRPTDRTLYGFDKAFIGDEFGLPK